MSSFLRKRLSVIPITIFLVLLLNFLLVNLAEEPLGNSSTANLSSYLEKGGIDYLEDDFSRSYGLHLPIMINTWSFMSQKRVLSLMEQEDLKILRVAPFIIPQLSALYSKASLREQKEVISRLISIGTLQSLTSRHSFGQKEVEPSIAQKIAAVELCLENPASYIQGELSAAPSLYSMMQTLLCETRLFRYFKKVCLLDFGTLRYDSSKRVLPFVSRRLGTSLMLLMLPLILTFILAQLFGLVMALKENKLIGILLSLFFAALYAIPIYIMAPLLIEKIGLRFGLPIHGLSFRGLSYFILPTLALLYGGIAIYSRINKVLFRRLLSHEYLLVAKAKGLTTMRLIFVHTLREALLTTIPMALGSIGFFMGGLIIIENLFEIEGFGGFFYTAILTHDYNVIVFSTLLISMITMLGYLLADIILYQLDPRISRNADQRVFEKA